MSETTNLKLFKHDNLETNTEQFDVDKALNENWDKIDEEIGQKRVKIAELEEENERLKQDLNALPSGQAEGETIDITDSAEMRFSEFDVRGNSRQDGTPTLDTHIEVESCGDNVNLVDCVSINGYVKASGEIVLNASTDYLSVPDVIEVKPNTTYTIDFVGYEDGNFLVAEFDKNKSFIQRTQYSTRTFITSSNCCYIFPYLYKVSSYTTIGTKIKLVKGTQTGAYSPYGQGCINEVVCNKNLFDKDKSIQNYYYDSNGVLSLSYNWFYQNVKVKPNTVYYISGNNKDNNAAYFVEFDKNMNFVKAIGYYSSVSEFTTSDKTEYVGLSIPYYEGSDNDLNTLQLEEGSTSTDYIPHQSQTFSIPTQQPMRSIGDIRDTFVKINNKWHERHYIKRKIFDGTINRFAYKHTTIYTDTNSFYQLELPNKILGETGKIGYGLCNYLEYVNKTASEAIKVNCMWWENSERFNYASIPFLTLEEANAWLVELNDNGNSFYIDYVLATPTDIECTEEQTAILDEIENTVKSYKGVTHIYSTDEVGANVEVTYKKDIETLFANTLV